MKTRSQLKKVAAFLLAACIIIGMVIAFSPTVNAVHPRCNIPSSGQMGDNVYWTMDLDRTLTVSGTGATWDLKEPIGNFKWRFFWDQDGRQTWPLRLKISEGITSIGDVAFCEAMFTEVWIPVSVTSIGSRTFFITNITDVYYAGSKAQWEKIKMGRSNDPILNATIHFGAENEPEAGSEPSTWAKQEVASAIDAGLVPESLQANYQTAISRGDVAEMFINLLEKSSGKSVDQIMAERGVAPNPQAFSDTSSKAVLAANALGILNGTGNGQFSPDATLTRAEIAAIINRVATVNGVSTSGYAHSFTDVANHWVNPELGWPSSVGIINGVGNNQFDPNTKLTTEQSIVIAYRALEVLKSKS